MARQSPSSSLHPLLALMTEVRRHVAWLIASHPAVLPWLQVRLVAWRSPSGAVMGTGGECLFLTPSICIGESLPLVELLYRTRPHWMAAHGSQFLMNVLVEVVQSTVSLSDEQDSVKVSDSLRDTLRIAGSSYD